MPDLGSAHGQIDIDLSPLRQAAQQARVPLRAIEQDFSGMSVTIAKTQQQIAASMDRLKGTINLQQRQYQILAKEVEEVGDQYGIASAQAQKKQLALDRLTQSITNNERRLADLNDELAENARRTQEAGSGAGGTAGRFGSLRSAAGGLTTALGAMGVALGAAEIVQWGIAAGQAANELETTEATVRALAQSQTVYNEITRLAAEQQRLYGGSLAENIAQLGSLASTARNASLSIEDINTAAQRLLILDPAAQFEDAAIALREAFSGDVTSLAERFELSRTELAFFKDEAISGAEKLALLNAMLTEQGATLEALGARAETTAQVYRDLGAAWSNFQTGAGEFLSEGFAPAARGTARLLTGDFQAMGESAKQAGEAIGAAFLAAVTFDFPAYEEAANALYGYNDALDAFAQAITDAAAAADDAVIVVVNSALGAAVAAELRTAAGDIDGALALMREAANLTEEEFEELEKALTKAAKEGWTAFQDVVSAEIGFLAERESAYADHEQTLADLTADYSAERADLQNEILAATTEEERAALTQQLVDLEAAHADKIAVQEEAFKAQEQQAAEAYAREQAAQMAHLGQMLIDYTVAQATMAGISEDAIAEMTDKIAAAYGVQTSVLDRSYGQMTRSIDEWVVNGGQSTDEYLGQMQATQDAAVEAQQTVDTAIAEMTAEATRQFQDGEISAEEYAKRLQDIPAEAEAAAQGVVDALATIPAEVTTTYRVITEEITRVVSEAGEKSSTATTTTTATNTGGVSGKRAAGGPVSRGLAYLVGEEGPELFRAPANGRIDNATATRAALASLGTAQPTPAAMGGAVSVSLGGISINNPVVDSTARIAELQAAIVDAAATRISRDLKTAVDAIILGGV